jgi:transcriptional regulator with XRE-family HTH domain
MTLIKTSLDPKVIEAEETLLIDFHFQIQEMMSDKGISRTELAEKAGISKARLSQILSNEANPTLKSMARLFHALGERVCVTRKALDEVSFDVSADLKAAGQQWQWTEPSTGEMRVDDRLVAVIKDTGASNDNYQDRFVVIPTELDLEAA